MQRDCSEGARLSGYSNFRLSELERAALTILAPQRRAGERYHDGLGVQQNYAHFQVVAQRLRGRQAQKQYRDDVFRRSRCPRDYIQAQMDRFGGAQGEKGDQLARRRGEEDGGGRDRRVNSKRLNLSPPVSGTGNS